LSDKEKQVQLARYRLTQAEETLDEAKFLLSGKKSPRSIINRAYYSMYYSLLSLLIFEEFISSKHIGMLSFFNREFIKTGIFPKEMGKWINKAFELRQTGDYREYADLTLNEVEPYVEYAGEFKEKIIDFLEKNRFPA